MLFIKSLFLVGVIGGGIAIPLIHKYSSAEEKLESLEYEATTKKWKQLLDKIPGGSVKEKISLIFSRNLTTFASSAIEGVVKQLLVNWIIEIWENPEQYFPLSHRLNKFFSYYHFRYWKSKNELDELSWDLVKNFFIDFFYKEKGWFFLSKSQDFRSFVLQKFIEKEKPFTVYESTVKYEKAESGSTYDSSYLSGRRLSDSFLWPELQKNERYSNFISKYRNRREVDLSFFSRKSWTVSELKKVEDSHKLGILLHLLAVSEGKTSDSISPLTLSWNYTRDHKHTDDVEENPLYLFLEKGEKLSAEGASNNEACVLVSNKLFQTDFSKKITSEERANRDIWKILSTPWVSHSCLYGVREIKNSESGQDKRLFASREKEGVSFYYIPDGLKKASGSYKLDELSPELSEKVYNFLKENFEEIFAKYLTSLNGSQNGQTGTQTFELSLSKQYSNLGKWSWSKQWTKYKELLDASTKYLDQLYWVENIFEFQKKLSESGSSLPTQFQLKKNKKSGSNYKIQLTETEGLFSPLPYSRKVDSTTAEKEISFSKLRTNGAGGSGNGADSRKNDGWYTNLFSSFMEEKERYSLEEKAKKLREELKKLQTEDTYEKIFYEALLSRSQLERMINDKSLIKNTLFQLWAEKELFGKVDSENHEELKTLLTSFRSLAQLKSKERLQWLSIVQTLLEKVTKAIGLRQHQVDWSSLLEDTFFLEPYLSSSLQDKAVFGSHKHTAGKEAENEEALLTKAKNAWILKTYFLSDAAYNSSSEELQSFLHYLFAVKWLATQDHSNLQSLISSLFKKDKNKNAYLVWLKEVDSEEVKALYKQEEEKKEETQVVTKLPDLFKRRLSIEMINPLLFGKSSLTESEKSSLTQSGTDNYEFKSGNVLFETKAYRENKGRKEDISLGGFFGLVTPTFSSRELPVGVREKLFNEFFKGNSRENTNYSLSGEGGEQSSILEGLFFEDNYKKSFSSNEDLQDFLDNLRYKDKLHKYLNTEDKRRPYPELLKLLSSKNTQNLESYTIQELRRELSSLLSETQKADAETGAQSSKDLYRMWNRFSGYWYDNKTTQKYLLQNVEGGKTKNYVVFLYQVNQWDFSKEKVNELKENLSESTFNTMLSLLASNKKIQEWIYNTELTKLISLV